MFQDTDSFLFQQSRCIKHFFRFPKVLLLPIMHWRAILFLSFVLSEKSISSPVWALWNGFFLLEVSYSLFFHFYQKHGNAKWNVKYLPMSLLLLDRLCSYSMFILLQVTSICSDWHTPENLHFFSDKNKGGGVLAKKDGFSILLLCIRRS